MDAPHVVKCSDDVIVLCPSSEAKVVIPEKRARWVFERARVVVALEINVL